MGTVWINDYHPYVPQAEWGGYKQSGTGRELGLAGLEEYRETKHVWHNIRPAVQHWFSPAELLTGQRGVGHGRGPVRRRHRGWWVGRLRAREPPLGGSVGLGAGARGGSHRPLRPAHPRAGRAAVPDRQLALRLEVRERAGAGDERPPGLPRPRQGARRLVVDQRDDLPARQPDGLRALGRRPGHGGVGLPPLPALLQADGVADPARRAGRRRCLARRLRSAEARAQPGHQPALQRVLRVRPAGRLPAHRRRQRLPPGGLRALRPQHRQGRADVRGARLPAPGDGPQEPHGRDVRARHEGALRGQARRRRRLPPRRSQAPVRRRRRGRSSAAVRSTRPQLLQLSGIGNPEHLRPLGVEMVHDLPGRGGEPPGPPRGLHPVRLAPAGLDRRGPQVAQPPAGRPRVAAQAHRHRGVQPLRGRRLLPVQRGRRLAQPDVPLPADRDPLRRLAPGRAGQVRPRLPGPHRPDVRRHPRLGADRLDRPAAEAEDALQLPVHADRPREWVEAVRVARDILNQPAFAPFNGGELSPGPSVRHRRGDPRLGAQGRRDRPAPVLHGEDGHRRDVGRRPGDHGRARHRGPAGRRRLRLPLRHQRQHLRPRDDGRREGRRPHRGQHAAPCGRRALLPPPRRHAALPTRRPPQRPSTAHPARRSSHDRSPVGRQSLEDLRRRGPTRSSARPTPSSRAPTSRPRPTAWSGSRTSPSRWRRARCSW